MSRFSLRSSFGLSLWMFSLLGSISAQASPQDLRFQNACRPATSQLTIAAVGDVLPHTGLAEQAYRSRDGFQSLWRPIIPWIKAADMGFANLEGPAAAGVAGFGREVADPGPVLDGVVYTGTKFLFNYHPRIVGDLQASGFSIISTANNHSLDRGSLGVDRTVEAFVAQNQPFVGTRHSSDRSTSWHKIVRKNGWNVAWIACTENTNGIPDSRRQALRCFADKATILNEIRQLTHEPSVDAVIVAPHWGVEYQHSASNAQRTAAREYLNAGASAVIGSHPHVLQQVEKHLTPDGRETLIAYSLGNFVSGQGKFAKHKTTVVLYVGLSKGPSGKAWVNGMRYLPVTMDRGPHSANLLELSRQAKHQEAYGIIHSLMDPSRELRAGQSQKQSQKVITNGECRW